MPDGVEDDVNLPPYIRLSFPTVVTPGGRALPSVTRERRMEDMRLHLPYSLNLTHLIIHLVTGPTLMLPFGARRDEVMIR